ncbi:MAG: hypothetical protein IH945_02215 [Armatimonadetes bacterium]|nr:hypothetical protein [Armatimonadota bacterium]
MSTWRVETKGRAHTVEAEDSFAACVELARTVPRGDLGLILLPYEAIPYVPEEGPQFTVAEPVSAALALFEAGLITEEVMEAMDAQACELMADAVRRLAALAPPEGGR